ncbi:bifunctional o-acetylhomoserine/o-acetylserine sulfhydrylase [Pseudarthrobacter sp. PS3-L1]|uniref:bifunctional o-acetylhomoserine/o-acetylserine sulfhydrylase n=1 Tax=Pseudarthrobacter sp. PS3-L1 TaxID=3046207 RepID=UPI0024B93689|nr:bifunctional o-acetylhomoserine/o-acetylserine sulfhydrylase [Pseudarthrobacter sp. PS3-L1]MDJ0319736.1 bifunctional o-acetylhomoserine/o-acetylserine sulfhydrylase [Pseudarthrobacter sp. PS3-L1]
MSASWSFETRQIHAGQSPDTATGARALPIYQTTSFVFPSAESAANRFALKDLDPIYTRIGNPTQDAVEQRIASLEGGLAALLLSSGQAASTLAILNVAESGDHVVASPSLYGGTYNLLAHTLKKFGISVTFVADLDNLDQWRDAALPNTKLFFGEVVSNPRQDVLEIEGISAVAHEVGVPLIVDNTLATPYLIRPLEWGADIVVHSATKYLGGHGTAIGGVIVDSGKFDFSKDPERFPNFNTPDPSYNGLVYARDLGADGALGANLSYILKARVQLLRDLGPSVSPFNAFLIAQGLETLSLRVERHVANATTVAQWLEARDDVESVAYAGLASSPWYERGRKYGPRGTGAIVSFVLPGGADAGQAFVDALELHSNVANIGDVRSLVIHPASTTHSQLTAEQQATAGVLPGMVRLSVGLEHIDDILADLDAGFRAAKTAAG